MKHLHSFTGGSDGAYPYAGLTSDAAGNLYGTTFSGGATNGGTVFKLAPNGKETVLHSFNGGNDGAHPYAGLVSDGKGNLYGTTNYGGYAGVGTVFKLTTGGTETVLHSFTGSGGDGANPVGPLIMDTQGNLYGTTEGGGNPGLGIVFKLTQGGAETVLHSFTGINDGQFPAAGLVSDAQGNMYGVTGNGGATGDGVIFKVTPGGTETVLYALQGLLRRDGTNPSAALVTDPSGNLYGTSSFGGASNKGTVFELAAGGTEVVLYSFKGGSDGAFPNAGLIFDRAGNLFGTTSAEGAGGCGTVFKLTPGRTETVVHSFMNGVNGCDPRGSLVFNRNALFGTTSGSGSGISPYGAVFLIGE